MYSQQKDDFGEVEVADDVKLEDILNERKPSKDNTSRWNITQ